MTTPEARQVEQDAVAALVRASLAGDHDAFRQLVERKRDFVYRVAYNQLGDRDQARSVAQAVFVRVWQNLGKYDLARPFDTWLYQVAQNAAIDHHRRVKARPAETLLDERLHEAPREADAVETAELSRILRDIAGQLGEKQRQAFLLREVEGLSTKDVAEALGTTESTVRNHVFQARRIFREELLRRHPEYARGRTASEDDRS